MNDNREDKKREDKNWWLAGAVFCLLLMQAGFVSWVAYLYFFDTQVPVEFPNQPFPVRHETLYPGDTQIIEVEICPRTTAQPYERTTLVNNIIVFLAADSVLFSNVPAAAGCLRQWAYITVPQVVAPGVYYFSGNVEYRINFVRTRSVNWRSEAFLVIPEEE